MAENIQYPIIELTEWVFDEDGLFWGETRWEREYTIRENDLEKYRTRILVDSSGKVLSVSEGWVTKRKCGFLSIFLTPMLEIEFDLETTGVSMPLEDLKIFILSKTEILFEINEIRFISQEQFVKEVRYATTYSELITIATFLDYQI